MIQDPSFKKFEQAIAKRSVERSKKGNIQNWTDAGYSLFSSQGPSVIQIERLARVLGKNKSGFYYFFSDRESFLECLMKEHGARMNYLTDQIRSIRFFDPEYLHLLIEHKETFFFQVQLVRNQETELYNTTRNVFNSRISAAVLPVWSDYLDAPVELADKLWGMTRDTLYCRATVNNFGFDWLREFIREAKYIVDFQRSRTMVG